MTARLRSLYQPPFFLLKDFNRESIKMENESYQDVVARLGRVAIYAQGLTQAQFAAKLGIGRVTLNLFLNRRCNLRPETAKQMAEALNIGGLIEKACGNEKAALQADNS